MDVLKKLALSIYQGRGLVGISLPVRIFEKRSLLERFVESWTFAPTYLKQASMTNDPIERMKLAVAFVISGLHT